MTYKQETTLENLRKDRDEADQAVEYYRAQIVVAQRGYAMAKRNAKRALDALTKFRDGLDAE